MVDFNFINGNISPQEQEYIKEKFLTNLAEFREEFEGNNPVITIDLSADRNSSKFAQFNFEDKGFDKLTDFVRRFQLAYPAKKAE